MGKLPQISKALKSNVILLKEEGYKNVDTDSVRLTTAFGSDHPVVSRSGRKSNLIYTCMYI